MNEFSLCTECFLNFFFFFFFLHFSILLRIISNYIYMLTVKQHALSPSLPPLPHFSLLPTPSPVSPRPVPSRPAPPLPSLIRFWQFSFWKRYNLFPLFLFIRNGKLLLYILSSHFVFHAIIFRFLLFFWIFFFFYFCFHSRPKHVLSSWVSVISGKTYFGPNERPPHANMLFIV